MCIKAGIDGFKKKFSEVASQTSLDIAFGTLSEMLGNHWFILTVDWCKIFVGLVTKLITRCNLIFYLSLLTLTYSVFYLSVEFLHSYSCSKIIWFCPFEIVVTKSIASGFYLCSSGEDCMWPTYSCVFVHLGHYLTMIQPRTVVYQAVELLSATVMCFMLPMPVMKNGGRRSVLCHLTIMLELYPANRGLLALVD